MKKEIKKYKLTDEKMKIIGRPLYRIQALIDIPSHGVKAGDLGGFVESENNLSHEDACWIADNAFVYENATVYDNAIIYVDARVYGKAEVFESARVYGKAEVFESARVYGRSRVYGNARVFGNARVYGKAYVCGNAKVFGREVITECYISFAIKNNIPYYLMDGEPIVFLILSNDCEYVPLHEFIKFNSIKSISKKLSDGSLYEFETKRFYRGYYFCFDTVMLILDLMRINLKFKNEVIKNNLKLEEIIK